MLNGIKGVKASRTHPLKHPICEKELKKSLSREGNHQQYKAVMGVIFQPQQEGELGNFVHVVLPLGSRIQERSYGISLYV